MATSPAGETEFRKRGSQTECWEPGLVSGDDGKFRGQRPFLGIDSFSRGGTCPQRVPVQKCQENRGYQCAIYSRCSPSLAVARAVRAENPHDKFLWLEDVTGDKALNWVKERNAISTGELTKEPGFAALNERLLKILDSKDRIPGISKDGPWYYNFWRDDKNKRRTLAANQPGRIPQRQA